MRFIEHDIVVPGQGGALVALPVRRVGLGEVEHCCPHPIDPYRFGVWVGHLERPFFLMAGLERIKAPCQVAPKARFPDAETVALHTHDAERLASFPFCIEQQAHRSCRGRPQAENGAVRAVGKPQVFSRVGRESAVIRMGCPHGMQNDEVKYAEDEKVTCSFHGKGIGEGTDKNEKGAPCGALLCSPYGNRTRVLSVKGTRPNP